MLARHAAALRERLAAAADELDDAQGLRAGRLRIAAFPSAGSVLVPPAIAAFRARHPGVELTLAEAEPDEAADGLRDGRFDVAVIFEYEFEPVLDPAGIVLPPWATTRCSSRSRPAIRARATSRRRWRELAGETWVSSADREVQRLLDHGARRAGFAPKVAFASDDYGAVGRLVVAGVGVALVPELAAAVGRRRRRAAPARRRRSRADQRRAAARAARRRRTRCSPCSGLRAIDPLRPRRRAPAPERVEQRVGALARPPASRGARR